MTTIQGREGRYAGFAIALLLAALGASSCVREAGDDELIQEAVVDVPIGRCGSPAGQRPGDPLAGETGGCLQEAARTCTPAGRSCRIGKGACCGTSICLCGPKKCTCT